MSYYTSVMTPSFKFWQRHELRRAIHSVEKQVNLKGKSVTVRFSDDNLSIDHSLLCGRFEGNEGQCASIPQSAGQLNFR